MISDIIYARSVYCRTHQAHTSSSLTHIILNKWQSCIELSYVCSMMERFGSVHTKLSCILCFSILYNKCKCTRKKNKNGLCILYWSPQSNNIESLKFYISSIKKMCGNIVPLNVFSESYRWRLITNDIVPKCHYIQYITIT